MTSARPIPPVGEVETYRRAWVAAREAAASATRAWAGQSRDELRLAIASGAAADSSAEALDPSFEHVAQLIADGRTVEDLAATADERLMRSSLRAFAGRRIAPHAQRIHREDADIPGEIISAVGELGLFGLSVPEQYGGHLAAGGSAVPMLIATEELSAASLAAG